MSKRICPDFAMVQGESIIKLNQAHSKSFAFPRSVRSARGNAISFQLPTEQILQKLNEYLDSESDPLPRSGHQLRDVAKVILRTNKDGHTSDQEVKTLIHQATVRRQARLANMCKLTALVCSNGAVALRAGGRGLDHGHEGIGPPSLCNC